MAPDVFMHGCSLEITGKDIKELGKVAEILPAGMAISITFLPGNTIDELIAIATQVRALGFIPVPHISARRLRSHADLERFLYGLKTGAQIDRVFLVGGDPDYPVGPFEAALDVIETNLLADMGIGQVGIAGYPEGHPKMSSSVLRQALHDKLDALQTRNLTAEIVTQFAFDADIVLQWVSDLRADNVDAPVRIGIPGPATAQSLLRFAARCGVTASTKVLSKYGISLGRLLTTATPDRLIDALSDGLTAARHGKMLGHVYPFGGLSRAAQWLSHLSEDADNSVREQSDQIGAKK